MAFETSMDVAFSGEASAYWQKKVDAFESLRVSGPNQEPDRERIVAAGVAHYEAMRDEETATRAPRTSLWAPRIETAA